MQHKAEAETSDQTEKKPSKASSKPDSSIKTMWKKFAKKATNNKGGGRRSSVDEKV